MWSIINKQTGEVLASGFNSPKEAKRHNKKWIRNYARRFGQKPLCPPIKYVKEK